MSASGAVDRLALRLARGEPEIYDSGTGRHARSETALENVARALAAPVTRRRAVLLIGATVAAGSLLRPRSARAQNCWPGGPKICERQGRRVCVADNLACCSNDNCAIACPYPWRDCEAAGNCADTERMCTDSAAPGYMTGNTKFCWQRIPVTNGCVDGGVSQSVRGWCCAPDDECGEEFGSCECPESRRCDSTCCATNEECVSLGLFQGEACLPLCNPGWHHDGRDCVCDFGQSCGVFCCGKGLTCIDGKCVTPPTPPKLRSLFDAFDGFFDTANQSSAAHGDGGQKQLIVAARATGPVGTALLALAAVNAQGVSAGSAFDESHVDRAYRRKVVAARPALPRIPAGPGLDPTAARALEQLLAAETKGFGLALACATALARARGATHRHDLRRARQHVLAAAAFAGKAARALRPVPSLRSRALRALQSTGAAEVVATSADIASLQADVRAHGVPADLRDQLRRLGVRGRDVVPVRAALLAPSPGGPTLIAPLADPTRTRNLASIATELGRFSRSARRRPILRSRGKPKRYRPRGATAAAR